MQTEDLRRQNTELLNKLRAGQGQMKSLLMSLCPTPSIKTPLESSSHYLPVGHEYSDPDNSQILTDTNKYRPASIRINSKESTPIKVKLIERTDTNTLDDSLEILNTQLQGHTIGLNSFTLTPRITPSRNTPKSILKRRKIIDRNVKVDSDYDRHQSERKAQRLQWSYKLCDSPDHSAREESPTDTAMPSLYPNNSDDLKPRSKNRTALYPFPLDKSLISDPGNIRVKTGSLLTGNSQDSSDRGERLTLSRSTWGQRGDDDKPLLGYDWIAADLDNTTSILEYSDSFFDDIKEFRIRNREDCQNRFNSEMFSWFIQSPPQVKKVTHTCVHGYTLNDRLYPEPINPNEDGRSVCPVCLQERQDPVPGIPSFVRISIPRSTLLSPYKIKPHRRKSFDATDAISLSSHCMVGWDSSRPAVIPSASTMDLKQAANGITEKLITETEPKDLVESLESMGKRLVSFHGRNNVLDLHRSLLFELESQNKSMDKL